MFPINVRLVLIFALCSAMFGQSFGTTADSTGHIAGLQAPGYTSLATDPGTCTPNVTLDNWNTTSSAWKYCDSTNHWSAGRSIAGNLSVANTLLTNGEACSVGTAPSCTCTTAATISAANGSKQKITLTNAQTCALTFTQPTTNSATIQIKVVQSAAGSFNGTISGGLWPGGIVPTITATTGAVDFIVCYLDGTSAYCQAGQNFQ